MKYIFILLFLVGCDKPIMTSSIEAGKQLCKSENSSMVKFVLNYGYTPYVVCSNGMQIDVPKNIL